jgi:hypothetical protein
MENKGITVSDAFNTSVEELEKEFPTEVAIADEKVIPVADETPVGEVVSAGIKSETKVTDEVELGKKLETETVVAETKEKTWTELGLPQYEGMTKEQVAERISFTNREYGRATNTIGELRKQIGSVVRNTIKPAESKDTKADILAAIPNLSESDTVKFNEIYATNPAKAILTFGGEGIRQMVKDEIKSVVPKDLNEILTVKSEQERYNSFLLKNNLTPDSPEVEWMKTVDTEYLTGQNRSYDELFELQTMWKNKTEGVEDVYDMMKRHPTMSISEAKRFVQKTGATIPVVQTVDKNKVQETIKKLNNANNTSQTVKTSEDIPVFNSVQEAFDS